MSSLASTSRNTSKRSLTFNKSFVISVTIHILIIFGVSITTYYKIPLFKEAPIINVKLANSNQDLMTNFIDGNPQNSKNNLVCKIEIKKDRTISNKDKSGKILEYTLNVSLNLEALSTLDGSSVLKKSYSEKRSYKASKFYLDTLSREKIIADDLVKSIANQITNDLNLIYN